MEKLNLDNKLLKPIKEKLENSIDILTKNAMLTNKEAEITLKIIVGVTKRDREIDNGLLEYLEPSYEYQITEKIKENKDTYKGNLGYNYDIRLDDENNLVVLPVNEQQTLFEED